MPRVYLPAILSGVLLWAAFFPLDLGPLGFVALVPWLTLVRAPVTRRSRYLAAYVGGVTFYLLATNWVRVAHPMMYLSWLGLSVVFPLYWVLGLDLIRRADRRGAPLALSVPVVWVALEYMRMHFPTGFPFMKPVGLYQMIGFGWYFLGYTQHAFLPFIQVADLGGIYLVSFLVGAVNGLVADWSMRLSALRLPLALPMPEVSRRLLMACSLGVPLAVGGALIHGVCQLDHPPLPPGPRVAAIQGSVPQYEKNLKGESLEVTYGKLHLQARDARPAPDLIVWPETCFAGDWLEVAPGSNPPMAVSDEALKCAHRFAGYAFGSPVLLGLNGIEWEGSRLWKYNSALLLTPYGRKVGRYDKMHLVPFGEYVPLKEYLPFMQVFTPYKEEYSCRPGEHWTRFPLDCPDGRHFTFGCLICYEDSDPDLARRYVDGDPVNFLVNISNDGWFDGTEEHEQHLAICRFRAIEARRSIIRSVNMGISALIDSDGRVIALPADSWSGSKKMEAVVSAIVPIDDRQSWYAAVGDWVPAGCWALLIGGLVATLVRKPVAS
jgi:apolipoprotein N-acyltransferase